jgi:hypothetical protein
LLFGHESCRPILAARLEWELLFTNAVGAGGHVMFPRVVRGTPVRFPAQYRYAEDYGLWCRLSRLGRVVCPPQVVYRYRQHESSITSRQKAEQRDCLAQMRTAYQRQYLQSHVPAETLDEVSRFWTADGRRPSPGSLRTITSIVLELRSNVLSYVDQRYGSAARADLEAEIDANLEDRLGYWLFRSMRSLDGQACVDLLALAMARRQTVTVVRAALDRAGNAFRRKLAGI